MSKIVLMAPGGDIAKHAYKLQEKLGNEKHFQIVHAFMEGAVSYARKYLDETADIIIARGNTAKLMKSMKLRFPIVSIPISNTEIIDSIKKAKNLRGRPDSRIGYIGLEESIQGVQEFLEMLNYSVTVYPVNSGQDLREQIVKAKSDGMTVVVGGINTQRIAREEGIDSVLLESSLYSITQAYEQAKEVQRSVLQHKKKLEEQNTLIDSISEGVVSISEKGRITLCNSRAQKFLRTEERLLKGERFDRVFKPTEAELIRGALNGGALAQKHAFDIQGAEYDMDINPVIVHKRSKGVIATIRRKESRIEPSAEGTPRAKPRIARFSELVGESLPFQLAVSAAKRFAALDAPLLMHGEFGTGKETFASCVHCAGPRDAGMFIRRRADALTAEDLLAAHQGTLFIDEISDLTPESARMILDLADRGVVRGRKGETKNANVRIIAGTTKNLRELTERNRFDQRLYYALNSFILRIPNLKEREGDVPLLFDHFVSSFNREFGKQVRRDTSVIRPLREHRWPGNLRELENLCHRLVAAASNEETLTAERVDAELGDSRYYLPPSAADEAANSPLAVPIAEEKSFIINRKKYTYDDLRSLDSYYHGKRNLLAEKLGISRSTLWRYLKMIEPSAEA